MGMARKSSRAVSGTIKVTGVVISLQISFRAPEVVHTPLCSRRLQLLPGLDSQKYLEFISAACCYPLRALGNGQQTTQSCLLRRPETLFSSPKMVLGLCYTTDACSITAGIGSPSLASKPPQDHDLGRPSESASLSSLLHRHKRLCPASLGSVKLREMPVTFPSVKL